MKRKLAYLALPLVLAALVFGVKWRAEHPTPTKEDLAVRAILLSCRQPTIYYDPHFPLIKGVETNHTELEKSEVAKFADDLFLLNNPRPNTIKNTGTGMCYIVNGPLETEPHILYINFSFTGDGREGRCSLVEWNLKKQNWNWRKEYGLHPVTSKSWVKLFLNHPIIGPELRNRIK